MFKNLNKKTIDVLSYQIISKPKEMKLLENKDKAFEPMQNRDELTDDLHRFPSIILDTEIINSKQF